MAKRGFSSCDFVVRYTPGVDTSEELSKKILYSIIIKRLKAHKPAVIFIGGDSGEGKSFAGLRLQQLLLELQGLKLEDYINDINVYTPLEYPEKLDRILNDKALKKLNIICMHEARTIVKAKAWQSYVTQGVAEVNAMSRSIKRLCIIIISQFIRDITSDVRYTLNYYCKVSRPKGLRARLYINVMWKDDRDLEKPKLRKRKLAGYLVYPNGRYRRFVPQYLELKKPSKEVVQKFEASDYEAKADIIKSKMNKLIKEMREDLSLDDERSKVSNVVDWYVKHPENITNVGKQWRGKWRLKREARDLHDLTKKEAKQFEDALNERLKDSGRVIEDAG